MFFKPYLTTMYVEDIKNNYYIVKLNEKHNLNDFSCGLMIWMTF